MKQQTLRCHLWWVPTCEINIHICNSNHATSNFCGSNNNNFCWPGPCLLVILALIRIFKLPGKLYNFPSLKVKSTLTDSSIKKGREGGRVGKDSKICNIKPHNNFHIEKNYQTLFATHCLGSSKQSYRTFSIVWLLWNMLIDKINY